MKIEKNIIKNQNILYQRNFYMKILENYLLIQMLQKEQIFKYININLYIACMVKT